jgi:hypothetical protein
LFLNLETLKRCAVFTPEPLVLYPSGAVLLSGDRNVTRRALTFIPLLLLVVLLSPLAAQPRTARSNTQTPPEFAAGGEPIFDERAAAEVLGHLRDGLEGHSQRLLLAAFDAEKMDGFLSFSDQIEAYFTRYESFRLTYHILQTSQENDGRGVILADFEVENEPRGGGRISRRQAQLRFELVYGSKGWKIVDMNPRGFFS